jgi:hypothetical protein
MNSIKKTAGILKVIFLFTIVRAIPGIILSGIEQRR